MSTHRFGPDFLRIFVAGFLQETSFFLMVHFPSYVQGMGATESLIGFLYAGGAIMALLFRPLLGRILDLTHRRTVLLFCGISNVTVVALLSLTSHWGVVLWALFLLQRVFQIALFTTMLTYMADSLPVEHRTQGLALFGMSGLIPIAFGGVIGDLVIDGLGFSALFLLSAAAGLISWSIVWSLPVLPVMSTRPRRGFWSALAQRNLLPLWWITLCFSIGMETLFTFTRTYVDDRQIGSTGIFFGVYGVTAAAMRLIGGNRYDRVPHRPLAVAALISYGVGLGLLAVAGSVSILVLAAFFGGLAHGGLFPLLSSQVVARARTAERGSAMAVFTSIFDIALLVAAPSVGSLIDGFDYAVAFAVVAGVLVVGSWIYAIWDRRMVAAEALAAA
ncbi:MAG: MFS transporter [Acidimicrobiia bacterium]